MSAFLFKDSGVHNYFIGLGANLGNRKAMLEAACRAITQLATTQLRAQSMVYETPAWGLTDQPSFYNQCLHIESELSPLDLLQHCQSIEAALGRTRTVKWGARLIDIDLIAWDGPPINTEILTLPHSYAHQRGFVLVPLHEIAPNLALQQQKIAYHLNRLPLEELTQIVPIEP